MFTSGTQARDGRTVNHDPYPYRSNAIGRHRDRSRSATGRFAVVDPVYDPRPEYAVLDNPILAAFRQEGPRFFGGIEGWLTYAMGGTHCMGIRLPDGAIDHARRVLRKLAALES